jgi:antitoxin YefM
MNSVSVSAFRADMARQINRVIDDRDELVVTGPRGAVVMMELTEFEALRETAYLLQSPENARRLVGSIQAADAGLVSEFDLSEFDL